MPTTWNPNDKGSGLTLSNNSLTANFPSGSLERSVRSTTLKASGKWYFECTSDWVHNDERLPGIMKSTANLNSIPGNDANGYGFFYDSVADHWELQFDLGNTNIGGSAASGDAMGVAVDLDGGFLYFLRNGTNILGNAAAGTGGTAIALGTWYAGCGGGLSSIANLTANFGASGFGGRMPAGYSAWDTTPFATKQFDMSVPSISIKTQVLGV